MIQSIRSNMNICKAILTCAELFRSTLSVTWPCKEERNRCDPLQNSATDCRRMIIPLWTHYNKSLVLNECCLRPRCENIKLTSRTKRGWRKCFLSAASIWFENWGVVDPGKKMSIFLENFRKILIFLGNLTNKKSIFQGKFQKNFDFLQIIFLKFQIFKANFRRI